MPECARARAKQPTRCSTRLVILPVTRAVAELARSFKRRDRGRTLALADCLIAATAALEGATLATGNVRDYPMPEITLLRARR